MKKWKAKYIFKTDQSMLMSRNTLLCSPDSYGWVLQRSATRYNNNVMMQQQQQWREKGGSKRKNANWVGCRRGRGRRADAGISKEVY